MVPARSKSFIGVTPFMLRVIKIVAKCSDQFIATMDDGLEKLRYEGYVPRFFPGQHYGDYVMLDIDIDSGKIINWKAPTKAQIADLFEDEG